MPESKGVKRVDGSQPEAVAYRINPSIHLRRTMRYSTGLNEPGYFIEADQYNLISNLTS